MTTTLDVEQEVVVAAPREKVFDALCRMGEWWPHAFREGSAVHLEPRVGGRFWEDWGDGDGALYATVTGIRRPEQLTCSGPMGMRTPVTGVFSMELEERARRHPGAAVPPRRRPDRRRDPRRLRGRLGRGLRRPARAISAWPADCRNAAVAWTLTEREPPGCGRRGLPVCVHHRCKGPPCASPPCSTAGPTTPPSPSSSPPSTRRDAASGPRWSSPTWPGPSCWPGSPSRRAAGGRHHRHHRRRRGPGRRRRRVPRPRLGRHLPGLGDPAPRAALAPLRDGGHPPAPAPPPRPAGGRTDCAC